MARVAQRATGRSFSGSSGCCVDELVPRFLQDLIVNRSIQIRLANVLALGGLSAIVSAGFMAHSRQAVPQAPAWDAEETFQARCSTCHAEHGEGSEVGASLNVPDLRSTSVQQNRDEFLRLVIKRGKGNMPAFGRDFSEDQIDRIIKFVRSFAAQSSPQPQTQNPNR